MKTKKILADYHKIYRASAGSTIEEFEKYESFCKNTPMPAIEDGFDAYQRWYNKLANFMESQDES